MKRASYLTKPWIRILVFQTKPKIKQGGFYRHKAKKGWQGGVKAHVHHAVGPELLFSKPMAYYREDYRGEKPILFILSPLAQMAATGKQEVKTVPAIK